MNYTNVLDGMAEELTSIMLSKTANVGGTLPTPNYAGGAKPFLQDSLKRGWQQGGGFGKVMTGLGVGMSLPGALAKEDPSGQGKSRPERLAEVGGATAGGLIGGGAMSNLGNMINRKIDPTDHYLTDAEHQLDTRKFNPVTDINNKPHNMTVPEGQHKSFGVKPGESVPMTSGNMRTLAENKLQNKVQSRSGTLFNKVEGKMIPRLNTGNLGNWAKFKAGRAGLNMIPGALGVAGSVLGMGLGEKLMGLPFRPFRSNPQAQAPAPQEQVQPIS